MSENVFVRNKCYSYLLSIAERVCHCRRERLEHVLGGGGGRCFGARFFQNGKVGCHTPKIPNEVKYSERFWSKSLFRKKKNVPVVSDFVARTFYHTPFLTLSKNNEPQRKKLKKKKKKNGRRSRANSSALNGYVSVYARVVSFHAWCSLVE